MQIRIQTKADNPRLRIFFLDDTPSVLHPEQKTITINNISEADSKHSSPVAVSLLRRLIHDKSHLSLVDNIKMAAIGGKDGIRQTDVIAIELKEDREWGPDATEEDVISILEERLDNGGTIIIVPDIRGSYLQATTAEIVQNIIHIRPDDVVNHNKDNPDKAITVSDWQPETGELTLKMSGVCGSGNCASNKVAITQALIKRDLGKIFDGINVSFEKIPERKELASNSGHEKKIFVKDITRMPL